MRNFIYLLLLVIFIWYFKVCIDNWNSVKETHNSQMKEYCPCEKYHYVTKGYFECDCPKRNNN